MADSIQKMREALSLAREQISFYNEHIGGTRLKTIIAKIDAALIDAREAAPPTPGHDGEIAEALREAWGALNFILAFYEPGQRYLDTEAWKQAEASGRRVHAKLRKLIDGLTILAPVEK